MQEGGQLSASSTEMKHTKTCKHEVISINSRTFFDYIKIKIITIIKYIFITSNMIRYIIVYYF